MGGLHQIRDGRGVAIAGVGWRQGLLQVGGQKGGGRDTTGDGCKGGATQVKDGDEGLLQKRDGGWHLQVRDRGVGAIHIYPPPPVLMSTLFGGGGGG